MKDHELCPYFETCLISNLLKTIDVPEVLRYCAGNYQNCRYLPRSARSRPFADKREPAKV